MHLIFTIVFYSGCLLAVGSGSWDLMLVMAGLVGIFWQKHLELEFSKFYWFLVYYGAFILSFFAGNLLGDLIQNLTPSYIEFLYPICRCMLFIVLSELILYCTVKVYCPKLYDHSDW